MTSKTPPTVSPDDTPVEIAAPAERESNARPLSTSTRIWRLASSTWLGVGLLIALSVLYGAMSIVEQYYMPPKSILPTVGGIYSHWTALVLLCLFCVNLLCATVRIPVKWDRAGAWCSHLGLMFLVVGSTAFWMTRTEGQCFIPREQNGSWPVVGHFFKTTDDAAFHVYDQDLMKSRPSLPPTIQTVFDSPSDTEPFEVNVPLKGTPQGVSITATKIHPRAELRQQWFDDEEVFSPAIEIQVSHGRRSDRTIMAHAYQDTCRFDMPECSVFFQASEPISQEEIDKINAQRKATTRPSREFFAIHYTGRGRPVLIAGDASGKVSRREFAPGQSVSTSHVDHPTSITLTRTMDRARRGINPEPVDPNVHGRTSAAAELTIEEGGRTFKRVAPYGAYLSGRPTIIHLPSGKQVYVAFSHRWLELPEPMRITRHEFKTAPASRMPEDYICDIEIGSGIHARTETLKLNFPVNIGKFRIHQSTWRPKEETPSNYNDPSAIILGIADRPGILLIFVGSIALCMGFPYAFYVKPLILKHKTGRARS